MLILFVIVLFLDSVASYIELVMAGLATSSHMISATLLSLGKICSVYRGMCVGDFPFFILKLSSGALATVNSAISVSLLIVLKT